jgi:oxygen-independent coproporphyrinogen III oxidase
VLPAHTYVHVPFCARRCSYCDFAIAVRREVPVDQYLASLASELALRYPGRDGGPLQTLYFGGGTPSMLGGNGIRRAIELVTTHAPLDAAAEVTIEANPDTVTPASARQWAAAGVNRVSLGGQSFSDDALQWMHRTHDADAIVRAAEALHAAGIMDISLDLIFALPASVPRDWAADLRQAIALRPTHISLYGLTVEPATPLGRWAERGQVVEAPEERYEADFMLAHEQLTAAGFEHYEVSSYARPGYRARHNSSYWTGVPYAGLGPGAHELIGGIRRWNVRAYAEWVARLAAGTDPLEGSEELTHDNRVAETVYLGLRTTDGLQLAADELPHVEPWVRQGWVMVDSADRMTPTPTGWLRLDSLAASLTHRRSCS